MKENNVEIEDLLEDFDDKIFTMDVNCDGVSRRLYSLNSVAKYMGVSLSTIRYAYSKKDETIRKMKGNSKIYKIDW